MRARAFAGRNLKEIVRDPLSLVFGVGFPVVLLLAMSLLRNSIEGMPGELFPLATFTPGMAVFGLSFICLFLGLIIAGDRGSAFLTRLCASPMTGWDYVAGYTIPMLPVALAQGVICFAVAVLLGLPLTWNILPAILCLLPTALLFSAIGLLVGVTFSVNQVGGLSSVIVNLCAWLSGTWFDLALIGGTFARICRMLPFSHAVELVTGALAGNYAGAAIHVAWVLGYAAVLFAVAVWRFRKKLANM